jgi:dolichol-phosphate mannosyltransferase
LENHKKLTEKSSRWRFFNLSNLFLDHKEEILRFYLVGATGLVINYLISYFLFTFFELNHLQSSFSGILVSLSSNFLFNKFWTFRDKNIEFQVITKQYIKYFVFNSIGILIQLLLVYGLGTMDLEYNWTILFAIIIASVINYVFNKKFIFKNKNVEIMKVKKKIK